MIVSCRATQDAYGIPPGDAQAIPSELPAALFASLQSGSTTPQVEAVLAGPNASRTDPDWPTLIYLVGEVQMARGNVAQARAAFRDLATWGAFEQSSKDGWGGSGLAAVALWRWLELLEMQGGTADEVENVLKTAAALQRTRLFVGMVRPGLLPALPLLEEDVARRLAHVAWKAHRPEATTLFLDFLSVDSTGKYGTVDKAIEEDLFKEGLATPERFDLLRLRRQLGHITSRATRADSADALHRLWANPKAPGEVRAEAGYEWSYFYRRWKEKKRDIVAVLTSVVELEHGRGPTAEKALYLRAMVQGSVEPKDRAAFEAAMNLLVKRYPKGRFADDALYQLASEYQFASSPDLAQAQAYFARLRSLEGSNDWLDSAYFLAAMGLVDRGEDADYRSADRLLEEYLRRFPDGPFRRRCLFWRGKLAELAGDGEAQRALFRKLVDEAPYDYYGLRASMHLESGAGAKTLSLPPAGSETSRRIRESYRRSVPDVELGGTTPYHVRLRSAERSGLFARLLSTAGGFGRRFHARLDTVSLETLEKEKSIPEVALLLSLWQDAFAARDASPTADNRLRLAGFLGAGLGDWSTALAMTFLPADAPHDLLGELQNDPRYLASVYPRVEDLDSLNQALLDAAWRMDGSTALSKSLMYGVIRRESSFSPEAISPVGALGLFQIMPAVFEGRKDCRQPVEGGRASTPSSYLFDPARNSLFWSCWVQKELKPETRGDVALLLIKHHAGVGNLQKWMKSWKGRGLEADLELQIDTLRFPATTLFVRNTLTDIAIADASGVSRDPD